MTTEMDDYAAVQRLDRKRLSSEMQVAFLVDQGMQPHRAWEAVARCNHADLQVLGAIGPLEQRGDDDAFYDELALEFRAARDDPDTNGEIAICSAIARKLNCQMSRVHQIYCYNTANDMLATQQPRDVVSHLVLIGCNPKMAEFFVDKIVAALRLESPRDSHPTQSSGSAPNIPRSGPYHQLLPSFVIVGIAALAIRICATQYSADALQDRNDAQFITKKAEAAEAARGCESAIRLATKAISLCADYPNHYLVRARCYELTATQYPRTISGTDALRAACADWRSFEALAAAQYPNHPQLRVVQQRILERCQ